METLEKLNNVKTVTTKDGEKEPKMIGNLPENSVFEFEPTPFDKVGEFTRTTNKKLCMLIKAKFSQTFHDLRGVMIHFRGGQFITEFYFEQNADPLKPGQIHNLENLVTQVNNSKSFLPGQQAISNKLNGRMFTLNDETKLLLSDFMMGGRRANHPNDKGKWDKNIKIVDSQIRVGGMNPLYPTTAHEVYVMVTGLDLRRLLKGVVYGETMVTETKTNADGKTVNLTATAFYEPRYMRPLPSVDELFAINVDRFDKAAVEKSIIEENPTIYNAPNGVAFY